MKSVLKKVAIPVAKYAVAAAILAYLVYRGVNDNPEAFKSLRDQPKDWGMISLSLAASLLAVLGTFVRWFFLVRATGIEFRVRDAVRMGFLAYLFNFVSLGIVGGDMLKIVYLVHRHKDRKAEAVASVLLDRAIGLYALLVVAAIGSWFIDFPALQAKAVDPLKVSGLARFCQINLGLVVAGAVALVVLMSPGWGNAAATPPAVPRSRVMRIVSRVLQATRLYRRHLGLLLVLGVGSLVIHVFNVLSMHCMAQGLPGAAVKATLAQQFVIGPLAMLAGTLPLPGGLGAFEFGYDFLHRALTEQPGLVIALGYRVVTILVAVIGVVYYVVGRAEVSELIHEAEEEESSMDN